MSVSYGLRMKTILTRHESAVFKRLSSPQKIQDYLDDLPINFELSGETYMSPRRVLRERQAHCFEGAVFAAAALAYHGKKPLLMDLKTIASDQDHVVALFKVAGRWGALSKTNHAILRYRDPIYISVRELALSYVNEYIMDDGRKSMRSYSMPFDLSVYAPEQWLTAEEDLIFLVNDLDDTRHFPIASQKTLRAMRRALPFEVKQMAWDEEWLPGKKPKRRRSHLS
jgi:hypothetical protein